MFGLVLVLQQFVDLKTTHIQPRVFQIVVPTGDKIFPRVATDQLHRLRHDIEIVDAVDLDSVFGLQAAESARGILL
jgi:hypothetical protein